MRMTDAEAGAAVRKRLEPLGRTSLSIIYADKSAPEVVIKAAGFWLDGEMYDQAALAEDPSDTFKREADIYEALGAHDHILKCFGCEYFPAVPDAKRDNQDAWALKLERAPYGDLRERILQGDPPSIAQRLKLALDLTDTLQYIHTRGVMWGDISTRNILLFDNFHVKLSDFAGSSLKGVYPEILFACEPRYWIPYSDSSMSASWLEKELFALGTGICEITEWSVPYGEIDIDELQDKLMKLEYPHVSEINPAKDVIKKLWHLEYGTVHEAADALRSIVIQARDLGWFSSEFE